MRCVIDAVQRVFSAVVGLTTAEEDEQHLQCGIWEVDPNTAHITCVGGATLLICICVVVEGLLIMVSPP